MSWPVGPWTSNNAFSNTSMPPDSFNSMGMTSEAWTAYQQQNWQQWAQWQQQYAQWQSQYGDKYASQMQSQLNLNPGFQSMGGMPPLPQSARAPQPAPPPPDQPPPPPYENNQPLFKKNQQNSIPPQSSQMVPGANSGYNNAGMTGNTQNWSQPQTAQAANNSNSANTAPTNNAPANTAAANVQSAAVNADALKKLAEEERLFDIQFKKWEEEIEKWKKDNVNHPDKRAYKEYEDKFEACRAQLLERRQQMKQRRANLMGNTSQAAPAATANAAPVTQNAVPANQPASLQPSLNNYSQSNQQFQNNMGNYSSSSAEEKSTFLPTSGSATGIPGLDLVPEGDKPKNQDVVDNTQDQKKGSDLSNISKGINSILGDEKIMNMLNQVKNPPENNTPLTTATTAAAQPMSTPYAYVPTAPPPSFGMNLNNMYTMPPPTDQQWNVNMYDQSAYMMSYGSYAQPPPAYGQQNAGYQYPQYYDQSMQYGGAQNMPVAGPPGLTNNTASMPYQNMNNHTTGGAQTNNVPISQPAAVKWVEDPLFTPSIIVEYDHKPLRLKARDFIEPVQTIDYNHVSQEEEFKKKKEDFEKEVEELFTRIPRKKENDHVLPERPERIDRFQKEPIRGLERRLPREEPSRDWREEPRDWRNDREPIRDDYRGRTAPREDFEDRRRFDDRRTNDREKYAPRDDIYRDKDIGWALGHEPRELGRQSRDFPPEPIRDSRERYINPTSDDRKNRSVSRDKDSRKRGRSKESEFSKNKKAKEEVKPVTEVPKHVIMIDDLLETPGREMRPTKIVIILRGPPGSGKSYLAKLIRDRESEYGGSARIMSIDDYFMQETEVDEADPATGKIVKQKHYKYEFDETSEETYINSLKRAFKRCITDGYFTFLIYDAVNDQLKSYADIWNFARQNGFQVYVCTMELDPQICFKRNIHNRSLEDIQVICSRFFPTPAHHIQVDPTTLLQNAAITDVQMEEAGNVITIDDARDEVESVFTSKWEKMDDANQLARLDGTSKPLRSSQLTMEDYLQLDDWKPNTAKPGKKTVRWADIEERRQQEKMRAIGFVVGQTDWNRMTDPTMGLSALTKTKYIERVRRF